MKQIIAIVGMPGAGKSEAANFFHEKGMPVLRFGSIIEEGIKEEGLERTAETERYIREKIRKELGLAAVAIKILPKIQDALKGEADIVILDGLYGWEEYVFLQEKVKELTLLCIYASPKVRYQRLHNRAVRSFTPEEARARDINELEKTNKGGPIALADYLIVNEGTKEEFSQKLESFFSSLR